MCHNDELSWLFTIKFSATRYMKVKRMGKPEVLIRTWLFSANKTNSSESFSKQPTQFIVELNSSLRHIIVTNIRFKLLTKKIQSVISNLLLQRHEL